MYTAVKRLIARHDDSHDEIKQQARYAAWDEGDQKSDPKPEWTNAEEFAQPAANARYPHDLYASDAMYVLVRSFEPPDNMIVINTYAVLNGK